ncbi:superoxide dismutase family protein [Robertkochia flava]|uniref:superoxide dismutase family protein n=1 Tax=Robertkochia flava TaxID=3447986 RepID=UPI001CCB5169|nr:superoxide dismutase family protein [Robertkochia marina]
MKKYIGILSLGVLTLAIGCKGNEKKETTEDAVQTEEMKTEPMTETAREVVVVMESKSGSEVKGEVTFSEENGVVSMTAVFDGLAPGEHAIHLHEEADCSADDATSTGGHWNPTFAKHGQWGDADGYHLGDIGNFTADETGKGAIQFATDQWCIGCGDEKKDILGKAVIVHQGTDDFTSQPSGAAGARVSCGGVIE